MALPHPDRLVEAVVEVAAVIIEQEGLLVQGGQEIRQLSAHLKATMVVAERLTQHFLLEVRAEEAVQVQLVELRQLDHKFQVTGAMEQHPLLQVLQ